VCPQFDPGSRHHIQKILKLGLGIFFCLHQSQISILFYFSVFLIPSFPSFLPFYASLTVYQT